MDRMRGLLEQIRNGGFAREFILGNRGGTPVMKAMHRRPPEQEAGRACGRWRPGSGRTGWPTRAGADRGPAPVKRRMDHAMLGSLDVLAGGSRTDKA